MKTVSVRELQQNLKSVLGRVERGETLEVTRRRRVIGRLSPARAPRRTRVVWPDLDERARRVLGDRTVTPPPSVQVGLDRGHR
jgi:antitoxin (DNA-binding transcriptional repressor) of toxin-antitoxin stability system